MTDTLGFTAYGYVTYIDPIVEKIVEKQKIVTKGVDHYFRPKFTNRVKYEKWAISATFLGMEEVTSPQKTLGALVSPGARPALDPETMIVRFFGNTSESGLGMVNICLFGQTDTMPEMIHYKPVSHYCLKKYDVDTLPKIEYIEQTDTPLLFVFRNGYVLRAIPKKVADGYIVTDRAVVVMEQLHAISTPKSLGPLPKDEVYLENAYPFTKVRVWKRPFSGRYLPVYFSIDPRPYFLVNGRIIVLKR